MSEPVQVGGNYTCRNCGEWCDGSEVHICPQFPPAPAAQEAAEVPAEYMRGLEDAAKVADALKKDYTAAGDYRAVGAAIAAKRIRALSTTTAAQPEYVGTIASARRNPFKSRT